MRQLAPLTNDSLSSEQQEQLVNDLLKIHKEHINHDLRRLGAVEYDMILPETSALPLIIHPDEHITGIVFGRYHLSTSDYIGRGALVATDHRLMLVDKKPLFLRCDEIGYHAVSAIGYHKAAIGLTVALHTKLADIYLRTFNRQCAKNFVEYVERKIFEAQRLSH